jgi:hypothetical protein
LDEFKKSDGTAITTHRRLENMDTSKYDLVIVDEDIILSTVITNRGTISISNLKKLLKKIAPNNPLRMKIQKILKHIKKDGEELFSLPRINYDKESYGDIKMTIDIPAFCSATCFCYRKASDKENNLKEDCICFQKPVNFKKNTKYIMVSATVNETICEYYFGKENVEFHECKMAEYMGTLNQFFDKPMSRACIANDPGIIDRIKKWSGFEYTITFLKYLFGDLHFGNTAGCDYLKGKNIDVIGTPHQPEWIYKLFAYSLGHKVNEKLKNRTVDHNGYRFQFMTYKDEFLRAIQFYIIESELEQAIGRARLLREYCIVNLFSNFPVRQANFMRSMYDNAN